MTMVQRKEENFKKPKEKKKIREHFNQDIQK